MTVDEARLEAIRGNAAFVMAELSGVAERRLGYDRASVKWVEGFIERRRATSDEAMRDKLVSVLGSYLGEAIRETAGGEWREVDGHGLGIHFPNDQVCFPFTKVAKQFADGVEGGESIASFYGVCVNFVATSKLGTATDGEGE
ncbi:MAG: hypothetical protein R3D27_06995 [Hyphomicrobiaceae bacterium]